MGRGRDEEKEQELIEWRGMMKVSMVKEHGVREEKERQNGEKNAE